MVKPEDITDSAMMLAEAVNDEIFRIAHDEVHVLGHTERKAAIARAIMAAEKRSEEREREACAQIIDTAQQECLRGRDEAMRGTPLRVMNQGAQTLARDLAAAIRNRSKP